MATNEELKEKVNDTLLLFIDFIYALVFWQIVADAYEKIIFPQFISWADVVQRFFDFLSISALFYFLAWDWIHARILTLKNPYKGYTRFFLEIGIAVCAYGAVLELIAKSVITLFYIGLILTMGVAWSLKTLRDYPKSENRREFEVIISTHKVGALIMIDSSIVLQFILQAHLSWGLVVILILIEWNFILWYEVQIPRERGVTSGPGVPLLSRSDIRGVRDKFSRFKAFFLKRKERSK